MLFRQMKYFQSVVETGSFTEAAEQCFVSQSAISQAISALESELGTLLLERKNRRFSLTPAGEYFYRRSLPITAELEQLLRDTRRQGMSMGPELCIGYLSSYTGDELGKTISTFSQKNPLVEIETFSGNHEDLYEALISGGADLVLNDQRRAFADHCHNTILRRSQYFVEVSINSPLAKLDQIEIGELKHTPCILVAGENQEKEEQRFFRDIIGFGGEFLFARSLQEARVLVISGRGILPIEGRPGGTYTGATFKRIPLLRKGEAILRNTCAFRLKENTNPYAESFEKMLLQRFEERLE
ncbi:MAG: LysR family transcriptional regulator [Firmicutes bacterium]|nr:LysR family transcriptional regulator [Bacillota bacterium]